MINRPIKFRAWKKETCSMVDSAQSIASILTRYVKGFGLGMQCANSQVEESDYVLMQFTGLLDSNGKEIYEGDIVEKYVETGEGEARKVYEVVFDLGGFCLKKKEEMYGFSIYPNKDRSKESIIGNVYSNPELLS